MLVMEQRFADFVYQPSHGVGRAGMAQANGIRTTLYQTQYRALKQAFYQAPASHKSKAAFGNGNINGRLYEGPRIRKDSLGYPTPLNQVVYQPSETSGGMTLMAAPRPAVTAPDTSSRPSTPPAPRKPTRRPNKTADAMGARTYQELWSRLPFWRLSSCSWP